jgi:hypothetical protein
MQKKCSKCEVTKPIEHFPNDSKCSDGKRGVCKECRKGNLKQWIPEENELLVCIKCDESKNYGLFAKHGRQKPFMCKECKNTTSKNKRREDPDFYNEIYKEYYNKNKERINEVRRSTQQKRRDEDPIFRIRKNMGSRIYLAVKNKGKTMELTGCSREDLKTHLESKFTNGMTWENYGEWHIDHIRPCASFNLEDPEEQNKCFHWTNLQPLWALDNIKKGDKWEEPTHSTH